MFMKSMETLTSEIILTFMRLLCHHLKHFFLTQAFGSDKYKNSCTYGSEATLMKKKT